MRLHNFSAGPGALPEAVLLEMKEELPVYGDLGASVLEISHRSAAYTQIEQDAKERIRRLLNIGNEWHVLFLQGGASMQFHQIPLNFRGEEASADYVVTGRWAANALKEAQRTGKARAAASSEDRNFSYIPDVSAWDVDPEAAYLHMTSNNTVVGTQFAEAPQVDPPIICDVSSDFLSRPIDMANHELIYAGAQKNIGPAGATVVLVHDHFLQRRNKSLPVILDYGTHAAKLYNTPPVFAVYVIGKVLAWLEAQGGLAAIEKINERKAGNLYARIDRTDFYRGDSAQRRPFTDECNVPPALGRPGSAFSVRSARAGIAGAERTPVGGRDARLFIQCLPGRVRGCAYCLYGRFRARTRVIYGSLRIFRLSHARSMPLVSPA